MSRLPLIVVVLAMLSGCTVYGHDDHGYRYRPYYYGGAYREHRHDTYAPRYYYYDRPDYRRYAPPPVRLERHPPRHDRGYSQRHDGYPHQDRRAYYRDKPHYDKAPRQRQQYSRRDQRDERPSMQPRNGRREY